MNPDAKINLVAASAALGGACVADSLQGDHNVGGFQCDYSKPLIDFEDAVVQKGATLASSFAVVAVVRPDIATVELTLVNGQRLRLTPSLNRTVTYNGVTPGTVGAGVRALDASGNALSTENFGTFSAPH